MRKLRRLRAEKGLTMDALEERTGVGKRTISEIERGMRVPHALTLAKLAEGLGVDLEDLVEEPEAPKNQPPRERPVEPTAGGPTFGELGVLAERRLLSSLDPFASQVEDRRQYWWELVDSGQVDQCTLEYATKELEFTSRSFKALVDAAIAERWSAAELGLLRRVYESISGPYRQAWNALMEAWSKGATSDMQGATRLRLVADADEAMRELEKAEEAVRTAA